ncbi:MAG: PTS glucose transporter subunit IIA [Lachnospiraceae bacterium]|nr:PTS glucose transporter subunit IIA [Lachnospiraceae bacterium]
MKAPREESFFGYAEGEFTALEGVGDGIFAGRMLGDGIAVLPASGKIYAPADGAVAGIFDTKHAICFVSNYGTEILIHIGMDTVKLRGEYFTAHVKSGAAVKRGQLLVEFDQEQVKNAGYDTVTMMIFTNLPKGRRIETLAFGRMTPKTVAAVVYRS